MSQELPEDYEKKEPKEPTKLREGETPDMDAHARRNAEMLRMARKELEEGDE